MREPTKLAVEVANLLLSLKRKKKSDVEETSGDDFKYRDLDMERAAALSEQLNVATDISEIELSGEFEQSGYSRDEERSFDVVTNKKNASKEVDKDIELDVDGHVVNKDPWKQPEKDSHKKSKEAFFALNFIKNITASVSSRISVVRHSIKNSSQMKDLAGPLTEKTENISRSSEKTVEKPVKEQAVQAKDVGSMVKETAKIKTEVETKESLINPGDKSHDTTKVTTTSVEIGKDGKLDIKSVETTQLGEYEVKNSSLGDIRPSDTPEMENFAKDLGKTGGMER